MTWYVLLIAVIVIERLAELVVSKSHWSWSHERGGIEVGGGHYPVMVALHTALLVGCLAEVIALHRPFIPSLGWPMLAVVVSRRKRFAGGASPRWAATGISASSSSPGRAALQAARIVCSRTLTTSPSSPRESRCRSCTRHGSPRRCSPC